MQPDNTVGYCAVISPSLDFWQAFFIVENDVLRTGANQMKIMSLMSAPSAHPVGSLQAVLAESALENNQTVVGAAALALHTKDRPYFYVLADRQAKGTKTSFHEIHASSIEEARDKIEALPEVMDIKRRLRGKMNARDGQGRRTTFH